MSRQETRARLLSDLHTLFAAHMNPQCHFDLSASIYTGMSDEDNGRMAGKIMYAIRLVLAGQFPDVGMGLFEFIHYCAQLGGA